MKRLKPFGPTDGFIHVLLVSIIYYLNAAAKKRPYYPPALQTKLKQWVAHGRDFCKLYRIDLASYDKYTQMLAAQSSDETMDDYMKELFDSFHEVWPNIKKDASISFMHSDALHAAGTWMLNEAPNKLSKVTDMVSKLTTEPALVEAFRTDTESQQPYIDQLIPLVKKLGGSGKPVSHLLTVDEAKIAKPKNEKLYKEYLELTRMVRGIFKKNLMNIVRENGGPVSMKEAVKKLKAAGVHNNLRTDFPGLVGEEGEIYTKEGKKLNQTFGPGIKKIVMNPDYNPKTDATNYFIIVRDTLNAKGKNNAAHVYTLENRKKAATNKFAIANQLSEHSEKFRAKWLKDMKSNDTERWMMGLVTEIVFQTCARVSKVGSKNTKGNTYGATSWMRSHVKRQGPARLIDYIGKDAVRQVHIIKPTTPENRRIIASLDKLCEDKQGKDLLFEYDGVSVTAPRLNLYLKKITGIKDVTAHKIRTMRGTKLAIIELDALAATLDTKRALTQAIVDKAFVEAITKVGTLLGHVKTNLAGEKKTTWTTASKNYVDPDVQLAFFEHFKDRGIRVMKSLAKALGTSN